jgi:uncharacterized protein YcgL (UPF0745 family)
MDKKEIVFIYLDKLFNKSRKIGKYTYIDNEGNVLLKPQTYKGISGEPQTSLTFDMSQKEFISVMFGIKQVRASDYVFEYIKTILIPDLNPNIKLYIS